MAFEDPELEALRQAAMAAAKAMSDRAKALGISHREVVQELLASWPQPAIASGPPADEPEHAFAERWASKTQQDPESQAYDLILIVNSGDALTAAARLRHTRPQTTAESYSALLTCYAHAVAALLRHAEKPAEMAADFKDWVLQILKADADGQVEIEAGFGLRVVK